MNWDLATNIILGSAILILGIFVVLGLYQWITRKSLKKVDKVILCMIIPLILMVLVYVLCDKILPHFIDMPTRPDGSGEPSFPSTHVMVTCTIFCLVAYVLPRYLHSRTLCAIIWILMAALTILCTAGRVIANKHSVVDVIGGLGFAAIFTIIYVLIVKKFTTSNHKKEQNE